MEPETPEPVPPPARPRSLLPVACGAFVLLVCGACLVAALLSPVVRAGLTGAFQQAAPADVDSPQTFRGPRCTLSYPGNWYVDEADEDYDPASYFSIDAPAQGSVSFWILDPDADVEAMVDSIAEELDGGMVRDTVRTRFERYGSHLGYGLQLEGTLALFPGRFRLFGGRGEGAAFVVMETRFDEDEAWTVLGYELVADSLELGPGE